MLENGDAPPGGERIGKRVLDGRTGLIAGVKDPRQRMATLARERDATSLGQIESDAEALEDSRASGASATTARTTSSSHSPWPTTSVSAMCSPTESASPTAPAIPPCAYQVLVSAMRPLVTSYGPLRRAGNAAVSPAIPLPMMSS